MKVIIKTRKRDMKELVNFIKSKVPNLGLRINGIPSFKMEKLPEKIEDITYVTNRGRGLYITEPKKNKITFYGRKKSFGENGLLKINIKDFQIKFGENTIAIKKIKNVGDFTEKPENPTS